MYMACSSRLVGSVFYVWCWCCCCWLFLAVVAAAAPAAGVLAAAAAAGAPYCSLLLVAGSTAGVAAVDAVASVVSVELAYNL